MNRKKVIFRKKVYDFLIEGYAQSTVSELLDVSKSVISYHTKILVEEKAIRPIGKGTPIYYRKGINSDLYDQICTTTDGVSVKDYNYYNDKLYSIHNIQFKCKIIKMPEEGKIPWEKSRSVNKSQMRWTKIVIPEEFAGIEIKLSVQECNKKTLKFNLGKVIFTSENIEEKNDLIDDLAHASIKLFSKFGYHLGLPEQCGKRHFAFRKPKLDNLPLSGKVNEHTWVDRTGVEDGKAHLETDSFELAIQEVNLSKDMIQNKKKIGKIENEINSIKEKNIEFEKKFETIENSVNKLSEMIEELPEKIAQSISEKQLYKPVRRKEDIGYR